MIRDIVLTILIIVGLILVNLYYRYDNENSILFNTFYFLNYVVINRLLLYYNKYRNKTIIFVYITEILFVVYLICVLILGSTHFGSYKALLIPSSFLFLFQIIVSFKAYTSGAKKAG